MSRETSGCKIERVASDTKLAMYVALRARKTIRIEITRSKTDKVYFPEWDTYIYAHEVHIETTGEDDRSFSFFIE